VAALRILSKTVAASLAAIMSSSLLAAEQKTVIEIVSAEYADKSGSGGIDVRKVVQALCGQNSPTCSLTCNGATFGRTDENDVKQCRITYRCSAGDHARTVNVDENINLVFACSEVNAARLASPLTAADPEAARQSIQVVHNRERAAVGVAPLLWSSELEAHAGIWAAHLVALGSLQHSEFSMRPGEGENLWMGSAGDFSPEQMTEAWADEKKDFVAGVFPNVSKTGDWFVVGHYTQMISRRSTMIGCAIAHGIKWDVLVCRYSPPGNLIGQKVY